MKFVRVFQRFYYFLHYWTRQHASQFYSVLFLHKKVIKYIVAGGTAALVNLSTLIVLTDLVGVWYLLSSTIAFILAFAVSFSFQKFWTFSERSVDNMHMQAAVYLLIGLLNLSVNAGLMYILVEWVKIWYLTAQIISSGSIAVATFFVYRDFIFKIRPKQTCL